MLDFSSKGKHLNTEQLIAKGRLLSERKMDGCYDLSGVLASYYLASEASGIVFPPQSPCPRASVGQARTNTALNSI